MSRLGSWTPRTLEERIDRLESLAEIQQLPQRYGAAVDSRDMQALVSLFVPDVRVGRESRGRDALRAWYTEALSKPRTSIHFVGNHLIDFDGPDEARGIVYCRDELERPDLDEWQVGVLQYWDAYRRVDGAWCFERRKFLRWYIVDAVSRPAHGAGVGKDGLTTLQLPEAFESWARFWKIQES